MQITSPMRLQLFVKDCFYTCCLITLAVLFTCDTDYYWWRSTVVERRSLTGELSLSYARPAADG